MAKSIGYLWSSWICWAALATGWGSPLQDFHRLRGLPPIESPLQHGTRDFPAKKPGLSFPSNDSDNLARLVYPENWSSPFHAQGLAGWGIPLYVRNIEVAGIKTYTSGYFAGADDLPVRNAAIWDGRRWSGFQTPAPYTLYDTYDIAVSGDKVYFAGSLDSIGADGNRVNSAGGEVAIWNGLGWELVDLDSGWTATALCPWNGKMLVAIMGTDNASGIWELDGKTLVPFGSPMSGWISRLEVVNGKLAEPVNPYCTKLCFDLVKIRLGSSAVRPPLSAC